MRTLIHLIRHGRRSDSDLISLGWHFSVLPVASLGGLGLAALALWALAQITTMLFGEGTRGIVVYYLASILLLVVAAGSTMMAVGVRRQRASGREDG